MVVQRPHIDLDTSRAVASRALRTHPLVARGHLLMQDAWWYLRNTPVVLVGAALLVAVYFLLFVGSHVVQGRIFPNVWSFGVYLGDLTAEEAELKLLQAFTSDVRIRLRDGDREWSATTAELGLKLDARKIVEEARQIGLAGIPFGWRVKPVVETEYLTAQNYLLDLSQRVEVPPYNAGYALQNGQVVGVAGEEGRILDVGLTLEHLTRNAVSVVERQRIDLIMQPLLPDAVDPTPYLDEVQALVGQPFQMVGYDPYLDESVTWTTTPENFISWLEAGSSGLTLRPQAFGPFLEAQTASLNPDGADRRYLEPTDTMEKLRQAIANQKTSVDLRIRYRPVVYEIAYGDRAYTVARKTGIPYYMIEESNPGRDLNILSPGDKIYLPSRDVSMPLDPVKNKRIIVDIDTQSLVAYENGQEVFSWKISTGIASAPTSPGIYQILSHNDVAFGSSFTLCGSQGCGQWKMYWFMGIYEVQPGLMNGFHGAVELPNGSYLGGGNVGQPYTFGCVMSLDANAKLLYEWAEIGTPVEIISREFPPQSALAKRAFRA
jgi:lipoprotein-anchoring transpeptidase ErfK/SrfK